MVKTFKGKIKHAVKSAIKKGLYRLGFELNRATFKGLLKNKNFDDGKLHISCGSDIRDGYINCNIRPVPGADLVCDAWEVSKFVDEKLRLIYARRMLEHMTLFEIEKTLSDWFDALKIGGEVEIIVPYLPYHIKQFQGAAWSVESLADKTSGARRGFTGLYGWPDETDPYIHKSGFDENNLKFFLQKAGFARITAGFLDEAHLKCRAKKILNKKERQVTPFIECIRNDHVGRYEFAGKHIEERSKVLDIACGIGYGSRIIAREKELKITAVDIHDGAVEYAKEYYNNGDIDFKCRDAFEVEFASNSFDTIVCFETIEHVEKDEELIKRFYTWLRPSGKLVCSVPNEAVLPFHKKKFPYHVRHYRFDELSKLVENTGFKISYIGSQHDRNEKAVVDDTKGKFLILVCTK